jgi:hypothetical protein
LIGSQPIDTVWDRSDMVSAGQGIGNTEAGWFNGSLDDIRIYSRALSASEIAHLADPCPGPADTLRVWFDSTTIHDGYIRVMMKNAFPVAAFTVPLVYYPASGVDSVSKVDCRTWNWQNIYGTPFSDTTLLLGGISHTSGSGPCLPAGEGPIARIYFPRGCRDTITVCFDTTYLSEPGRLLVTECSVPPTSHVPVFVSGCARYEIWLPAAEANAGADATLHVCSNSILSRAAGCASGAVSCELISGVGTLSGGFIRFIPDVYDTFEFVVKASDACNEVDYDTSYVYVWNCGDANCDCSRDITDAVYLISFIFSGGPAPCMPFAGDTNGDGSVDISDAVYFIAWIFSGGPEPVCSGYVPAMAAKIADQKAELDCRSMSTSGIATTSLSLSSDAATKALQLTFTVTSNAQITSVQSNIKGMDVFSGMVDGEFRVGLIDMTGEAVIPAGQQEVVTISYRGEGPIELKNAIVVGEDASKMNVTITSKGVVEGAGVSSALPKAFSLSQNVPNPFNPTTAIAYAVPQPTHVKLEVMNVLGQTVRTLVDQYKAAGNYTVVWDSRDNNGQSVASGIYLYCLTAGEYAETRKMVLMK